MKCILLVAGYATRLYPLTENTPKALLPLGGKPILDYILAEINTIDEVDDIYIVSNHRFYSHFCEWAKTAKSDKKIIVIDDNTTNDSNKLGAIGDMQFAIEQFKINDDLLVMAGDNLFTFKLKDLIDDYRASGYDTICAHTVTELSELQRMAVALFDENQIVVDLQEKPKEPKSTNGVEAFYVYNKKTIPLIKQYLDEGNNPDSPGNFPSWLYKKVPVKGFIFNGRCIDIGTKHNYELVNNNFKELFQSLLD